MQNTILQKCVEELKKENPKLDYVLGMLETVIEMSNSTPSVPYVPSYPLTPSYIVTTGTSGSGLVGDLSDEEKSQQEIAAKYVGGQLGQLQ